MHSTLADAEAKLGIALPALRQAATSSTEDLGAARGFLAGRGIVGEQPIDVVVLGSYARQEASGQSDFDFLVLVHGVPDQVSATRDVLVAVGDFIKNELNRIENQSVKREDRRPGATNLFASIVSAAGISERIGLEHDTNLTHSRRILLIEESVSVLRPDLHTRLLRSIFDRYMCDYEYSHKDGPPRFLLNDLIRYWYTLAVDYQAKHWEGNGIGWGLRYLKLINSRKVAYAGSLVSLLQCDASMPATPHYLEAQFSMPPLARLSQLALDPRFDRQDALSQALVCADRFVGFLADPNRRGSVQDVTERRNAEGEFKAMIENAKDLQAALKTVFFESFLSGNAKEYLAL